jgi:hypothetical protein
MPGVEGDMAESAVRLLKSRELPNCSGTEHQARRRSPPPHGPPPARPAGRAAWTPVPANCGNADRPPPSTPPHYRCNADGSAATTSHASYLDGYYRRRLERIHVRLYHED